MVKICQNSKWFTSASTPKISIGSYGLMFSISLAADWISLVLLNYSRQELPNECDVTGGGDPQNNFVDFVGDYFEVALLAFPIIRQHFPLL